LGAAKARNYIQGFYSAFEKIAAKPGLGEHRRERAEPFVMVNVQSHFVIYHAFPDQVLILTIQHQSRDIEALIGVMRADLLAEIEAFKRRLNG